ncbi:MAG TPA: hypothetical protein VFZ53_15980 [Polyangiaceae bacterium]
MIHRVSTRTFRAAQLAVGVATVALACSEGDDDAPPEPPGPVALAIGALLPRGSETWKPGDVEPVVLGCDLRLGVTAVIWDPVEKAVRDDAGPTMVTPPAIDDASYVDGTLRGDWLFRPPGACSREQCGTLRISVEPASGGAAIVSEVALESAMIDVGPLAGALEGRVRIRAELRQDGETTGTYKGIPLVDELEVELREDDCPPGGTGGTSSGGTSSGGTGGTGGGAGAGGAPGGAGEAGAGGA